MEDDVLVEYVFTQLEQKNINPKVMQIKYDFFKFCLFLLPIFKLKCFFHFKNQKYLM